MPDGDIIYTNIDNISLIYNNIEAWVPMNKCLLYNDTITTEEAQANYTNTNE